MKRFLIYLYITFAVCLSIAAAPTLQLRQFSTTEGLPNSMVRQVAQDSQGFIWIATFYGLYRYDGYEIVPFKSDIYRPNYVPSNDIVCLAADKKHRLWIGTQEGICRLDLQTYQIRKYSIAGASKKRINNIYITASGQVYAATIRGIIRYDEKRDSMLLLTGKKYHRNAPVNINTQCICEDVNGDLLIATWEHGLYRYSARHNSFIHYPDIGGTNKLLTIFKDSRHAIWVGTYGNGAMRITFSNDKRQIFTQKFSHPLTSEYVYAIGENTSDNNLWFGTRNGITIYDRDQDIASSTTTNEIRSIFKDADNQMWICTKGSGILLSYANANSIINSGHTDIKDLVSSILVEPNGTSWIGLGYGVRYCYGNINKTIIADKRVYHISRSRTTGNVYIATHDGGLLECRNGIVIQQYLPSNCGFISNKAVRMAYEDRKGNLWVATYNGLGVRYADGREVCLKDYRHLPHALTNEITSIEEDSDGSLWLATPNSGILHLTGNLANPKNLRCKSYSKEKHSVPVNSILCLKTDKTRRLWAGTDGCGLCLYDRAKDKFVSVHQSYNLPGDMACSIEDDTFGNLWIGTNKGLARLTFSSDNQRQVRVFTTKDGFGDNFFELNSSCKKNDRLYFGCGKGYVSLVAKDVKRKKNYHKAIITSILTNGERANDIIANHTSTLTLSPKVKDFTIYFSALDFCNPDRCSYAYRLKGFNDTWRYTGAGNRYATYTNLSPGTYTFEVKSADMEGNWGATNSITIIVEPPFWRTWWAYCLYIITGVALLAITIRKIRQRMLLRNNLLLQVNDGKLQVVVNHKDSQSVHLEKKKQLSFEIKDLNYTDADEEFIRNAIQCVNRHLSEADFDIPQFAEELCTSRTTLFKKLKSMTGMNATAFIRSIRLKATAQLLAQNPNMRISELAYQVGFNDPKYFSVCFKKEFGLSPSEYIEKLKR